jgi:hypothetical protein
LFLLQKSSFGRGNLVSWTDTSSSSEFDRHIGMLSSWVRQTHRHAIILWVGQTHHHLVSSTDT